jgi:hypothetical protein
MKGTPRLRAVPPGVPSQVQTVSQYLRAHLHAQKQKALQSLEKKALPLVADTRIHARGMAKVPGTRNLRALQLQSVLSAGDQTDVKPRRFRDLNMRCP